MAEYLYWEGNQIVRANGLIEIRRKFIQRNGKNKVANFFKKGKGVVGHIYYATGSWIYKDYIKSRVYVLREDGRIQYELQSVFY